MGLCLRVINSCLDSGPFRSMEEHGVVANGLSNLIKQYQAFLCYIHEQAFRSFPTMLAKKAVLLH
jgi:hypothetical protein